MEFIRFLKKTGYTVLMIEHDMSVVMNISDRIYVIDHGKTDRGRTSGRDRKESEGYRRISGRFE